MEFYGWIDVRDLATVKEREGKRNAFLPNRHLTIYDKHWYDGKCQKVKVRVLKEIK